MKKIGVLSILHFFVDMLCAISIFSWFITKENAATVAITYNFCAFALQMPLGALLDGMRKASAKNREKHKKGEGELVAFIFTAIGVILTMVGAFTFVWILGLGNALFHVGGGVMAIEEDNLRLMKGRGLGVFVAPGAIGLYLGTQFQHEGALGLVVDATEIMAILVILGFYTILLWFYLEKRRQQNLQLTEDIKIYHRKKEKTEVEEDAGAEIKRGSTVEESMDGNQGKITSKLILVIACCFICVVIRSYVGMAATFPWKTGFNMGLMAVIAVAIGKAAGGFLGAKMGYRKAAIISLPIAAIAFVFGNDPLAGSLALLFFNMTMPITLYALVKRMPETPGFAFGILTLGLFVGYLPWFISLIPTPATWILGLVGSILSLAVLIPALPKKEEW